MGVTADPWLSGTALAAAELGARARELAAAAAVVPAARVTVAAVADGVGRGGMLAGWLGNLGCAALVRHFSAAAAAVFAGGMRVAAVVPAARVATAAAPVADGVGRGGMLAGWLGNLRWSAIS